jgi:ATP-dependent exoDNAse (exonuclease V) beta subunit
MPGLKIIKASAGSGKTFQLTFEYLSILFKNADSFKHILAVTFTNKATEEMKSRILFELYILSAGKSSKQLPSLMQATGLNESALRKKAALLLKKLLHQYTWFSVSTIDAFFQRIIRSFTRELGIQDGYTIELDTESLLTHAIEKVFHESSLDASLLEWLSGFVETLIEKGENWDIKKGIRKLGIQIFTEAFKSLSEEDLVKYTDRKYLKEYLRELKSLQGSLEKRFQDFGLKAMNILKEANITVDDFSGKLRGPAGFLVSLARSDFRGPTDTALRAANDASCWHTATSKRKAEILQLAEVHLIPLMKNFIRFYESHSSEYKTIKVIQKNLYSLGILADLAKWATLWLRENNAFHIADAATFLNRIIDGNDTPFIYEKAGSWYHHFIIDEFQDTSRMQWNNFKPLFSNSISQGYENFVVGDAKQSIYRWRNSDWRILENQVESDFMPGISTCQTLELNYRSQWEIIQFNNRFFKDAVKALQQDSELASPGMKDQSKRIEKVYGQIEQDVGHESKSGGYVEVAFLEPEENQVYKNSVFDKVISQICSLQDKGYQLKDIAILTRKNQEAKDMADYLIQFARSNSDSPYRFDVISDEALQLGQSILVAFLTAILQEHANPGDATNQFLMKHLLQDYIAPSNENLKHQLPGIGTHVRITSLTELVEHYILLFKLDQFVGELAYLQSFRDVVADYSRKNSEDIGGFLRYWDDSGRVKSVQASGTQDAIQIITIHKAKGLEFKAVILPFCTWEMVSHNQSIIWCRPQNAPFNKLSLIPLTFSSQLRETCFANDYYAEYLDQTLDNLNLLYVAFTRAREALYIICKRKENEQIRTVSDLVAHVLGNENVLMGALPVCKEKQAPNMNPTMISSPPSLFMIHKRIRFASQNETVKVTDLLQAKIPLSQGRLLHDIFTRIRYKKDVQSAVDWFRRKGLIASDDTQQVLQFVNQAIHGPLVSDWFSDRWQVLNEAEIILPGGNLKRPDRIMISKDLTVIVDYKFGDIISESYEKQIDEYARLLAEIGFAPVEAYVWYVRMAMLAKVFSSNAH